MKYEKTIKIERNNVAVPHDIQGKYKIYDMRVCTKRNGVLEVGKDIAFLKEDTITVCADSDFEECHVTLKYEKAE